MDRKVTRITGTFQVKCDGTLATVTKRTTFSVRDGHELPVQDDYDIDGDSLHQPQPGTDEFKNAFGKTFTRVR